MSCSRVLDEKPGENNKLDLSLSVSKCKTFKDCKAKFYFSYIEKLPKKDWEHLTFGKFCHEILELFYKKVLAGNTQPYNVILSEAWKEAYLNWKPKLTKENVSQAKEICTQFLYQETTSKDKTVLAVEDQFYIDIDGKVLLNGLIDRVQLDNDGVIHVSDYKTTKNKKYLKNDFFQLLTYAFVMWLRDPTLKKVRGSYILLRHNLETIVTEFSVEEIKTVDPALLKYFESIKDEKLFRPNPTNLCKFCDYTDNCEAGKRFLGQTDRFGQEDW